MQYIVMVALFASFVFVPLARLPERLHWITFLNPLAVIIESIRGLTFGMATLSSLQVIIALLVSVSLLVVGFVAFERASRIAVDLA